MSNMKEVFNEIKEADRKRRKRNIESADPAGWTQHTDYHWSRKLNGKRLDYWPSKNKFQYQGRVMTGNVNEFIRKHSKI